MALTKTNFIVTAFHPEYLEDVLEIEQFNGRQFDDQWLKKDFVSAMSSPVYRGIVAWKGRKVVGFAIYALDRYKIEIINMSVHQKYTRQGVGKQMIMKLKSLLRPKRRTCVEVYTRDRNLQAHLFLKSCGFKARVCPNWYKKPQLDDAYKFEYKLEEEC